MITASPIDLIQPRANSLWWHTRSNKVLKIVGPSALRRTGVVVDVDGIHAELKLSQLYACTSAGPLYVPIAALTTAAQSAATKEPKLRADLLAFSRHRDRRQIDPANHQALDAALAGAWTTP